MKQRIYICLLGMLLLAANSALAGTKEEVERLQRDVLALQNQIRLLEKAFSEQTEGLKSLVVQLNDQVGKTNLILDRISTTLESQASNSSEQAILQEIQNLSNKINDQVTSISALAQQVNALKLQSKPINQPLFQSGNQIGESSFAADALYSQAFNDFVQGNTDLAIQGFTAYLGSFPTGDRAAAAQYYIGEAYYNQKNLPQAITAFTYLLNNYPEGDTVASALFKRGKAELEMLEKENAIADFKTVVKKYPKSPEADLAKIELQDLGVK